MSELKTIQYAGAEMVMSAELAEKLALAQLQNVLIDEQVSDSDLLRPIADEMSFAEIAQDIESSDATSRYIAVQPK